VFGVAISPKGDSLASVGWDDKLIVWDLEKGEERWSWQR
jgi:WD40 repeat protein